MSSRQSWRWIGARKRYKRKNNHSLFTFLSLFTTFLPFSPSLSLFAHYNSEVDLIGHWIAKKDWILRIWHLTDTKEKNKNDATSPPLSTTSQVAITEPIVEVVLSFNEIAFLHLFLGSNSMSFMISLDMFEQHISSYIKPNLDLIKYK